MPTAAQQGPQGPQGPEEPELTDLGEQPPLGDFSLFLHRDQTLLRELEDAMRQDLRDGIRRPHR